MKFGPLRGLFSHALFSNIYQLYTNETLRMFEREVKGMFSCFNSRQINADGPVVTYIVQEQVEVEGNQRDARDYEVCYNEAEMEAQCRRSPRNK